MKIGQANVPGKELTGLAADSDRVDKYALLRGYGETQDAFAAFKEEVNQTTTQTSESQNVRRNSRVVLDTDTLDARTLLPSLLLVTLLGTTAQDYFLHAAANFARTQFLTLRNGSTADWTIHIDAASPTDRIYEFNTGTTTVLLAAGFTFTLFNANSGDWFVY